MEDAGATVGLPLPLMPLSFCATGNRSPDQRSGGIEEGSGFRPITRLGVANRQARGDLSEVVEFPFVLFASLLYALLTCLNQHRH